jgi:hypothetical protein
MRPAGRTLIAGLLGGIALNAVMLLTFRLIGFGLDGGGILLDPAFQSQKLIAVWTELEPIPLAVSNPAPIVAGLLLFGVGHALVYSWLAPAWPPGILPRGLRMAALTFFLSYLFFEFFTPFNMFGEPPLLLALELVFWALVALTEAIVIAIVLDWGPTPEVR